MASLATNVEWIGTHVFLPASIVLLLAGIGLVVEGSWGFTKLWVVVGLAAFLFSVILGSVFVGPQTGRIKTLIAERGPEDPEVGERINKVFMLSRIELVVLILIVADMAIKPGA